MRQEVLLLDEGDNGTSTSIMLLLLPCMGCVVQVEIVSAIGACLSLHMSLACMDIYWLLPVPVDD